MEPIGSESNAPTEITIVSMNHSRLEKSPQPPLPLHLGTVGRLVRLILIGRLGAL
jgi:hypothetical protein